MRKIVGLDISLQVYILGRGGQLACKPALSEWLYANLVESGFKTVCVEFRHAQRFLLTQPVKTDHNDARGITEMMRVGHDRAVHMKPQRAPMIQSIPQARRQMVASLLQHCPVPE